VVGFLDPACGLWLAEKVRFPFTKNYTHSFLTILHTFKAHRRSRVGRRVVRVTLSLERWKAGLAWKAAVNVSRQQKPKRTIHKPTETPTPY